MGGGPGYVQVPGMNGPNTRGFLGKGLSAPVTPAVFGPFMPGTCNEKRRSHDSTGSHGLTRRHIPATTGKRYTASDEW